LINGEFSTILQDNFEDPISCKNNGSCGAELSDEELKYNLAFEIESGDIIEDDLKC
jgi:hypothetical protein